MKVIIAVIKPYMLDKLARALTKAPITGFTVCEARGWGRGDSGESDLLNPRFRLEIVLLPSNVDAVTKIILQTVSTHQEGDGIMYVQDVETVVNIRTGAVDAEALMVK